LADLRTDYKNNPLGIDSLKPRLSWKLVSDARSVMQTAYRIQVSTVESNWNPGAHLVWDSQKILSDNSIHVDYLGAPLESFKRYYWRVTVWDNKNNTGFE
jgi:alpha-L-rhamnosidase